MGYPQPTTIYAIEYKDELVFFSDIGLDYDDKKRFIFCRAESDSEILAPSNLKHTYVLIDKEHPHEEAEIFEFNGTFEEFFDEYLNEYFNITVSRK